MKRFLLLAFLVGCTEIDQDIVEGPKPTTEAQRIWVQQVLPLLQANCVGCHSQSQLDAEAFLAGDSWMDVRQSLLASNVVDVNAEPSGSPLLTKGAHSGPNLTNDELTVIVRWLEAERAEQ